MLALVRLHNRPESLVHIALVNAMQPWNYSLVCDAGPREDFGSVSKEHIPTCLQCIATLQNQYF